MERWDIYDKNKQRTGRTMERNNWILKDDEVCSVLIGASKPEQITENCRIVQHTDFSDEELLEIEKICNRA